MDTTIPYGGGECILGSTSVRDKWKGKVYNRDTICEFTIRLRADRITGYSCESGYNLAQIGSDISKRNVAKTI